MELITDKIQQLERAVKEKKEELSMLKAELGMLKIGRQFGVWRGADGAIKIKQMCKKDNNI